jgi:hypothetical protein
MAKPAASSAALLILFPEASFEAESVNLLVEVSRRRWALIEAILVLMRKPIF